MIILVAGIADVVRNAGRNEHERSRLGANNLPADVPLAFSVEHVKRLFLYAMHMQAGRETGGTVHSNIDAYASCRCP